MNILHVSSYYMKGLGYQENCLPKFQKKIIPFNEGDVIFYTSERSFPFANFKKTYGRLLGSRIGCERVDFDSGVKIIRKKPVFESVARCLCVFNPFDLYRVIKEEKISVIHLHSATNLNVFFLLIIGFFYNFKLFIDCHTDEYNSGVTRISNKILYAIFRITYKLFRKRISGFLPVTLASQDYLQKVFDIPGHKIVFTPLCLDHESMYFDAALSKSFRTELGGGIDTVYLGYFGKISPEKNVLSSLKIFNGVLRKTNSKKMMFLVVGDGKKDYMEEIQSFVESNQMEAYVEFLPMQDRKALRGYLSLCTAAFWIGSASNCIQEAMACKTVPFLSKTRVIEHLIFDERQDIDTENYSAAVEKVISIIEDENISEKIELFALENYTWLKSAKQHIEIYNGII